MATQNTNLFEQKKIKKYLKKENIIKIVLILFVIFSVIFWTNKLNEMIMRDFDEISKFEYLDDCLDAEINGKLYENVSAADFKFDSLQKGETVVMSRTLPDDWSIKNGCLRVYVRHCTVQVFIDNERVFDYGIDRMEQSKTLGSGYMFIDFPSEYKGKEFRMELTMAENKSFVTLPRLQLYEIRNVYRVLATENRVPFFVGAFLVIFGAGCLVISAISLLVSEKYFRMLSISCFSVCIGIWSLCYYRIFQLLSLPLYTISLIEHVSLYLVPLPLILCMHSVIEKMQSKLYTRMYWGITTFVVIMITIVMTLHTFDIVHFAAALVYVQFMWIVIIAFFIWILIKNIRKGDITSKMYLIGLLIITLCIFYDLMGYHIRRFISGTEEKIKGVTAFGMMVFVFIMIVSFYMDVTKRILEEKEKEALLESAYKDSLTKLYNRRYCAEQMQKIENDGNINYAIICFDVNNLKLVNDSCGHSKGDILIKSAAEVIQDLFSSVENTVVGRMGGDEFIAVIPDGTKEIIENIMSGFEDALVKKTKEVNDPDINISIASGYAFDSDLPEGTMEEVFQLADYRMYENKMEIKKRNSMNN